MNGKPMQADKLLQEIGVDFREPIEISGVQLDSRKVTPHTLYLALMGNRTNGARYIPEALKRGAALVLSESPGSDGKPLVVHVPGLRSKVSQLVNAFHGYPTKSLQSVGVTGTNGKTTVTWLSASLFSARGDKVIQLGTIENNIGGDRFPSNLTTPDAVELISLLDSGVKKGCRVLVMEASSHALCQDRLNAVSFNRAVFTNLTQDHLDYHKDFETYYQAKKRLFSEFLLPDGVAVINFDSSYGRRLAGELNNDLFLFSRKSRHNPEGTVDLVLDNAELSLEKTELTVNHVGTRHVFYSNLVGDINVENLLAAIALGFSIGMDADLIQRGIAEVRVPGRNEIISLPGDGIAVVDYAHTPDALSRLLHSLKPLVQGRLVCVFGCGGDRDREKRPMMGASAESESDYLILTDDNPRSEKSGDIIEDIMAGLTSPDRVVKLPDRREAIHAALDMLGPGDCAVIAGKGHEDYQVIGKRKVHFSDREEIEAWCRGRKVEAGLGN